MLLTGVATVQAGLLTAHAAILRAVAGAVTDEAEAIMADSKEHYCPVDTGVLRTSGIVLPAVIAATGVEVEMGYGGNASSYALEVHENLSANHPVGMAKYLEIPFLAAGSNGITGRIAANVKARI